MDFSICDHKVGFPKYSHIWFCDILALRDTIGVSILADILVS